MGKITVSAAIIAVVVAGATVGTVALVSSSSNNPYRYASFDSPWASVSNQLSSPACHTTVQDFGWRSSNNAGGAQPGEIGGTVSRATSMIASYGTAISPLTLASNLSASGLIRLPAVTGGGVTWGFYNQAESTEWRASNAFVLRASGDSVGWRMYEDVGTTNYLATGGGQLPPGSLHLSYSANYQFSLAYNGTTHSATAIITDVANPVNSWSTTFTVPAEMIADGATFDHFGILSQQVEHSNPATVYIDDLVVNSTAYSFTSVPGWDGSNNSYSQTDCDVHGRQNFGESTTNYASGHAGEIGGIVWRGSKAWFADTTAVPLNQNDTLSATGEIKLTQATSDTDIFFGWFNAATTWAGTAPVAVTNDAVYASVGGPSRAGFRFTPSWLASSGQAIRYQFDTPAQYQQPQFNMRGKSRRFTICYKPQSDGSAVMTTTLDGDDAHSLPAATSTVTIPSGIAAYGFNVDHFGIFTGGNGGHSAKLWVDDLKYTIDHGDSCS